MIQPSRERDAGRIEAVGERGVWVPEGLTGPMIMAGATALVEIYDLPPYTARSMATDAWFAMRAEYERSVVAGESPLVIGRKRPARIALIRLLCRCILGGFSRPASAAYRAGVRARILKADR
jgi:hypothetical protein